MMLPKEFGYYIKKGVIKKITPDKQKAEFLISQAEISLSGLKERIKLIGIKENNSSSIVKDCYDILMGLTRAKLFLDGYSSSGNFSHEAEISYLKNFDFSENEINFFNELRRNRNSVNYYGKMVDTVYAKKITEFASKLYPKLRKLTEMKK